MAEARSGRLALVGLAALSLAGGIWMGLVRLGFFLGPSSLLSGRPLEHHAPLMVSGFLGTLIGIERAVAYGRRWAWAGPALSGVGAAGLLLGAPGPWSHGALVGAAGVMAAVMVALWRRQPGLATAVMGLAPTGWLVGNAMLLTGASPARAVTSWAAFLILTIAGERLVLSRLVSPSPRARRLFLLGCTLTFAGALATLAAPAIGTRLAGAGWIVLASWLLRYDVARRRVAAGGLPRFVAVALIVGYLWLGLAGLVVVSEGLDPMARTLRAPRLGSATGMALPYDAALHALFLGFVFSMIFAHAPIILPAVLERRVVWHRGFWIHLVLLQVSVAWRVAGDLLGNPAWRAWAGVGHAVAIAAFGIGTAASVTLASSATGLVRSARPRAAP